MNNLFTFAAVGLAFDGIGVAILGYSFFAKSIRNLKDESDPHWDSNRDLLASLIQARTDGISGTSLLFTGFILQWFGTLGFASDIAGNIFFVGLFMFLSLYFGFLRKRLISIQVAKSETLKE